MLTALSTTIASSAAAPAQRPISAILAPSQNRDRPSCERRSGFASMMSSPRARGRRYGAGSQAGTSVRQSLPGGPPASVHRRGDGLELVVELLQRSALGDHRLRRGRGAAHGLVLVREPGDLAALVGPRLGVDIDARDLPFQQLRLDLRAG